MTDLKILEDQIPYVSDEDQDRTITSKKEVVVYILLGKHKEQWVFKIGRTNRLEERIKEIERETQFESCFILGVYHSFKNSVYRACRDIDSLIFHDQSKVKQLYALADVRKKKGTGTKEFYIACLEIWNIFHKLCQKYKGEGIQSSNCKFEDNRITINRETIVSLDSYSCKVFQIPTRNSPPAVSRLTRSNTPDDDDDDASDVSTRVTPEPPVYRTPIRRLLTRGGGLSSPSASSISSRTKIRIETGTATSNYLRILENYRPGANIPIGRRKSDGTPNMRLKINQDWRAQVEDKIRRNGDAL